jgi:D-alanyl-D-alanine-carboxypeptidase/D-alanyl-D-alanine-endopeptidase
VSALARACLVACAALAATCAQALPDDASVKALLAQRIAQKRAVGLAAVLYDKGATRIVTAGEARADGPPIAADTEFEIGSVTKTFTALLLADAVVRGRASLDDPVTKYVAAPGLARDGKAVTLGQLATHTSGLPRLPKNLAPANPADPYADYDAGKLEAFLAGDILQHAPGSEYEYSNLGMGLLGYALTASEGGYEKALRERVLAPLRMSDTAIVLSAAQRGRFASGHDIQMQPVGPWRLDALAGAGALRSTPADMAKYLAAAIDPSPTPLAAAWKLAETPAADGPSPSLRMALAWHVATRDGRSVVWHNGQTGGFAAMVAFDPVAREGVVVLSNAAIGVDDLALHLLDASIPLSEPPKQRQAVKLDPGALDRVAGRYELARDFVLTIRRDGDRVFAQASGQPEAEIFAESEHAFFYRVVDAQLTVVRAQDGRVTGLVLHQAGRDIKARRIEQEGAEKR